MSCRRTSGPGLVIVAALVATACGGSADPSSTSDRPAASPTPVTSTPDYFTEVRTSDVNTNAEASSVTTALTPDDSVADGSADAVDGTLQTDSSATTTSTSTTVAAGTGTAERDRALAAAFTAQLDADVNDDEFGAAFDSRCLGTELVAAFGGAAAADADYGLNVATVTPDGDLFDDQPLSKATADAVVGAFGRCGDFDDLLRLSLAGSAEDDAAIGCIVDEIRDGAVEASFSENLQQVDGAALDALDDAIDDAFDVCFD